MVLFAGKRVARAFAFDEAYLHKRPFYWGGAVLSAMTVPHPSGVNRWYNDEENVRDAKEVLRATVLNDYRLAKGSGSHFGAAGVPAGTFRTCSACGRHLDMSWYTFNGTHRGKPYVNKACEACMRPSEMLSSARTRAKSAGIPFDLTVEDIVMPAACPVFGMPFTVGMSPRWGPGRWSPTLDKLLAKLGYVRGRVRVVSYLANMLRNRASAKQLKIVYEDARRVEKQLQRWSS